MSRTRCWIAFSFFALAATGCGSDPATPASGGSGTSVGVGGSTTVSSSIATSASTSIASSSSSAGGGGGAGGSGGIGGNGGGISGPHTQVTANVIRADGSPAASEPIVVNDMTGAIVSVTQTAMDGKAQVDVPLGGMIAVYPNQKDEKATMQGVVDPPDGSTVYFFADSNPNENYPKTTFHVTASGYPAATVSLQLSDCDTGQSAPVSAGTTIADIDDDDCIGAMTNRVLVVAYDATNTAIAWGEAKDLEESPGNTVPVAITIDQVAFRTFTETITPIGPTATNAGFWIFGAGDEATPFDDMQSVMPPASSESWSFVLPDTEFGMWSNEYVAYQEGAFTRAAGRQQIYANLPPTATLDPTTLAPLNLDAVNLMDPAHPILTWAVGAGPQGDAIFIDLIANGGSDANYWISLPSGVTSFRLPDIPAALAMYSPVNATPTTWDATVDLMDQQGEDGWPGYYVFSSVSPAIGTVIVSSAGSTP
jgi:hypothetical protein